MATDVMEELTRHISAFHGPSPASRARTVFQEAIFALEDWQCYPDAAHARALLVSSSALTRVNPSLIPPLPLFPDEHLREAAALLDPSALFDHKSWEADLDAFHPEKLHRNDPYRVDHACYLWDSLRDALDLARALMPYREDVAFELESHLRPLVNRLGENFSPLADAEDLYLADAATMHPEMVGVFEVFWIESLFIFAVRNYSARVYEHYVRESEDAEGERQAQDILDIAKKAREKV